MVTFPIKCDGPGPHDPVDGIVGFSSNPSLTGMRCNSISCKPVFASNDVIDKVAANALVQLIDQSGALTVADLRAAAAEAAGVI